MLQYGYQYVHQIHIQIYINKINQYVDVYESINIDDEIINIYVNVLYINI